MPMQAVLGDITTWTVDAIVNAANERLARGGGVCGAIFEAAGEAALTAACRPLAPCPTGQARMTPGFGLPARFIIHAVGPVWYGGDRDEEAQLASCYRESLRLLCEVGACSIAFPAISTGIYGFPQQRAVRIAVAAARQAMAAADKLDVIFVCFDDTTLAFYQQELGA